MWKELKNLITLSLGKDNRGDLCPMRPNRKYIEGGGIHADILRLLP